MLGRAPPAGRRQKSIEKTKPLFTQSHLPASAHPLPPCSRWCPRLGSAHPPCPPDTRLVRTLPAVPYASGGPALVPPARKKEVQARPTPPPPLGSLSCLCCLGAAGHACQFSQNRLYRGAALIASSAALIALIPPRGRQSPPSSPSRDGCPSPSTSPQGQPATVQRPALTAQGWRGWGSPGGAGGWARVKSGFIFSILTHTLNQGTQASA
jgi:hypothetical protein